ncbi:MAG TPA: amidohydrolase family protein [Pseudolabrys sp.]|nr:amidohydrolase family protein [Pseudolabrys sp.]
MAPLRIVDAHHHLIDLDHAFYPWLSPKPTPPSMAGDTSKIAKPYLIDDYRAEFGHHNVVKSVHVEAGYDPANPVAETEWLQGIADKNGFPHAIVAKIELQSDDAEALMERHKAFRNVRGIRHMLNWHDDPSKTYTGEKFLDNPKWTANYPKLAKHGLSFDFQLYAGQMAQAAKLIAANEGVPVVIDHGGMPIDRSPEDIERWRQGVRTLAAVPHVSMKISGLGMCDHTWTVESIRPFVLTLIETFGPARCMFGSNFPVDRLHSTFEALFDAFDTITADFSDSERADLFAGTAERFYRI